MRKKVISVGRLGCSGREGWMATSVTPFLMFEGTAEAAANYYVTLFPRSAIRKIERYGAGEEGPEGSVKACEFVVAGLPLRCFDSFVKHQFTFTPSMSLFVECESEAELDAAFAQLSASGVVMMAPGNYGFSTKFAWVSDRFGVSWQLNLS
jgi:predicted 3-demethylubiquinone-9 3-methyltransferase (glyoxalase superfamily)